MAIDLQTLLNGMTSANLEAMIGANITLILIILIGVIILKGFALWFSARSNKKIWFWVLLVTNTLGILPAIYLIWFKKRR